MLPLGFRNQKVDLENEKLINSVVYMHNGMIFEKVLFLAVTVAAKCSLTALNGLSVRKN